MEIDIGVFLLVISEKIYNNLVLKNRVFLLEKLGMVFCIYIGEEVKFKGFCIVDVCYEGGKYFLFLLVVKEEGFVLLGRNWFEEIKINWLRIK